MNKYIKNTIKKSLYSLLEEEKKEEKEKEEAKEKKEKPKKSSSTGAPEILTRGAFGSGGRPRAFVVSAKARAESDPDGLLRDLGIRASATGNDLQQVEKILNGAIHSNSLMGQAYSGVSIKSIEIDKEIQDAVVVFLGELDRKNGVRFLAHTLTAASAVGFLSLESSVQFTRAGNYPIVIQRALVEQTS